MSNCSNCFNGCAEIVSDKCVKYTGVPIPSLGIDTGDTLAHVEEQLVAFLQSALDGTGIIPIISSGIICDVVNQYLPVSGNITIVDFTVALIKAACNIQNQIDIIDSDIATLNADYTVDCLSGVTSSSDTHDVVQAIINKLCLLEDVVTALSLDLSTNYVKLADLDTLIQAYLDSISPVADEQYKKMVPYTAIEFYPVGGDLSMFDSTGKGVPAAGWDKVYLCNGQNGTPDKRGRLPISTTVVKGGGGYSSAVNPSLPGNTNYLYGQTYGENTVTLTTNQIPAHIHATTVNIIDGGHSHDINVTTSGSDAPNGTATYPVFNSTTDGGGFTATNPVGLPGAATKLTGITTSVTNPSVGGGQSHNNVPPVLACYYIMYIPS